MSDKPTSEATETVAREQQSLVAALLPALIHEATAEELSYALTAIQTEIYRRVRVERYRLPGRLEPW